MKLQGRKGGRGCTPPIAYRRSHRLRLFDLLSAERARRNDCPTETNAPRTAFKFKHPLKIERKLLPEGARRRTLQARAPLRVGPQRLASGRCPSPEVNWELCPTADLEFNKFDNLFHWLNAFGFNFFPWRRRLLPQPSPSSGIPWGVSATLGNASSPF